MRAFSPQERTRWRVGLVANTGNLFVDCLLARSSHSLDDGQYARTGSPCYDYSDKLLGKQVAVEDQSKQLGCRNSYSQPFFFISVRTPIVKAVTIPQKTG